MAFNASTVRTRYIAAGSIAILKGDFTKLCDDMISIETYMATATDQVGKFSRILLARASTGASSATSGGAVSEVGAYPGTNIALRDLWSTAWLETSTDGHWKALSLATSRVGATTATGLPNTNIGILNLKGASILASSPVVSTHKFNAESAFQVTIVAAGTYAVTRANSGIHAYNSVAALVTGVAISPGVFKYFLSSVYISGSTSTTQQSLVYSIGNGGNWVQSAPSASTAQSNWDLCIAGSSTSTNATDNGGTGSTVTMQIRWINIDEV